MTKRKIASLNLTTGAPVAGFTANAGAQATALAATNSTLYVGGNFQAVNGTARVGLVAVNGATGAVVPGFVNFGDGTATSTSSAMSHTFPSAGTRTVTLTVTDGWGRAASITRQVTVSAT